jgi:methyl-accepting chemotaxis protein
MFKKNYTGEKKVLEGWNLGLKQKFGIKCGIDLGLYVFGLFLFVGLAVVNKISLYVVFSYFAIFSAVFLPVHFISRHWISQAMKRTLTLQSESMAKTTSEIVETLNSQKNILEGLSTNSKNISTMVEKLKTLSKETLATSKNTEKQVNQSMACSQKEHDAIAVNAEKMLTLRQKIQMIAELILELSEHTQQIGNTISVVDDIAEQTNMLALNAAVEAARAGEHGKGFAVVAGEIRKLADESKQAITKITSLTSNIQYTTNSTVMATEEGSKEIESVVKDINAVSTTSDNLLKLIGNILESLDILNQNALKQSDIIEKLNLIDEENKNFSEDLASFISANSEKLAKLNNLSNEIKNSVIEG